MNLRRIEDSESLEGKQRDGRETKGGVWLLELTLVAVREVSVPNQEGLHARPVSNFIKLAQTFRSHISVTNVSRSGEAVDGKSAMQMMLLNAAKNCILRIEAHGDDAEQAAEAMAALVRRGFDIEASQTGASQRED